jgi:hypothetical protein
MTFGQVVTVGDEDHGGVPQTPTGCLWPVPAGIGFWLFPCVYLWPIAGLTSDRAKGLGGVCACSENPPQFRQCKSRIFTAFRNVASMFLKYWVSERGATCHIAVGGER